MPPVWVLSHTSGYPYPDYTPLLDLELILLPLSNLKKTYYTKLILEIFLESGVILTENNICQLIGLLIYFDASMSQHISR